LRNAIIASYDPTDHTPEQEAVYYAITDSAPGKTGVYKVPSIEGYTCDEGSGFDK
jgi:hypothetical protein